MKKLQDRFAAVLKEEWGYSDDWWEPSEWDPTCRSDSQDTAALLVAQLRKIGPFYILRKGVR